MSNRFFQIVVTLALVSASSIALSADLPGVDGVFGLNRVTEQTYLAVWVPVDVGASVTGVRWYNNDSGAPIVRLLVQAGVLNWPSPLGGALPLATNIIGASSSWSSIEFSQAVSADCGGLYLYFQLPEGEAFEHDGDDGGFGIGYCEGTGKRNSWLTGNGENWNPMSSEFRMAVEPIYSWVKSRNETLVLSISETRSRQSDEPDGAVVVESGRELSVFPNPFNPMTTIEFTNADPELTRLRIYDIRGRVVAELVNESLQKGRHSVTWDGRSRSGARVASGVYFARVDSKSGGVTRRILLLK